MATMKRIWAETKRARSTLEDGTLFEAVVIADFGRTVDGDTVLRIERRLSHLVWRDGLEPCEDGCPGCAGSTERQVIVDPVSRNERDAVRLAIRHADELFERLGAAIEAEKRVAKRFVHEAEYQLRAATDGLSTAAEA